MNEEILMRAEGILKRQGTGEAGCCVLAQIDEDGDPTAATISPARIDGVRRVFFCAGKESNWVRRGKRCGRASVCFNSAKEQYNITLVGDIAVLDDPDLKAALWFEGLRAYFDGPQDPALCVLQFTTRRYSLMLSEHEAGGQARGTL